MTNDVITGNTQPLACPMPPTLVQEPLAWRTSIYHKFLIHFKAFHNEHGAMSILTHNKSSLEAEDKV
jgi:hypothetical protein